MPVYPTRKPPALGDCQMTLDFRRFTTFYSWILAATATLSLAGITSEPVDAQSVVKLQQQGTKFQLIVDGKPFRVKGVGGTESLDLLAEQGGNSIRTWDFEGIEPQLDQAHQQGLKVCVGMWLGHPRHGFNYHDETSVLTQADRCLTAVKRLKDHPAVLLWGIGNEMEGDGKDPSIWMAVDQIAREIKAIDPNHPTMTVIAELGEHKLQSIDRFCPNIDIVGVNSYAGIPSLARRYRGSGIKKPYIVTEHGPNGPWEVGKTEWGSPIESTSTVKAQRYLTGYQKTAGENADQCLGTYAFLWGQKQETTATWFGMLLPDGSRLQAIDAMSQAWTGKPVANRCPEIKSLDADKTGRFKPGQSFLATLNATDPEQDALNVKWVLLSDAGTIGVGGDAQAAESAINGSIEIQPEAATGQYQAKVTIPESGGGYRLYAYVRDDSKGAAVANLPFYVDAPIKPADAPKAKLPYVVYGEAKRGDVYVPSGHMGNTQAIQLVPDHKAKAKTGNACLQVQYNAAQDWSGVLWQSPEQDWEGKLPGGLDLTGAKALEFWARGENGGEVVNFQVGGIEGDQPYVDTARANLPEVRLTSEWKKYRIDLTGKDLSRIKTGFGYSLAGQGKPVVFYLDQIQFVP